MAGTVGEDGDEGCFSVWKWLFFLMSHATSVSLYLRWERYQAAAAKSIFTQLTMAQGPLHDIVFYETIT